MLGTGFVAILERALDAPAARDLALWALRGLTALDPAIGVEQRGAALRLTGLEGAAPSRNLPVPSSQPGVAAAGMAEPVAALMEAAWRASPTLRRLSPERVVQAAFDEIFDRLDPYSRYVTIAEARASRERRSGQAGLGLRLGAGPRGDTVVVVNLSPDGPAALSGLRLGERVLAVDGTPVSAEDLPAAAALLEGPANAPVALTVLRGGRRRDVVLIRNAPPPTTVQAERRDGILWLRVTGFSAATDAQILASVEETLRSGPPAGIVLDLRGNRGGVLARAVAVADIFLSSGEIVSTVGRNREASRVYLAGGPDSAQGLPLVVLVDGRSASAAEVVAASLADRGRALVVGSATQGKGLVQLLIPLPNGGEMLLSWSRLIAPRGWPLQDLGVMPHLCTSRGPTETAAGLAALARGEAPLRAVLDRARAARVPLAPGLAAEIRAACPPAEARDGDVAIARALIEAAGAWQAVLGR